MPPMRMFVVISAAATLAIASPAQAQNKGGEESARIDSVASFTMDQYWQFANTSQYFGDTGAVSCPRCGKFVVKKGVGDKIDSIKFKKTSNEKIVGAYYRYFAFDGSGFDTGKSNWSGLTRLRAHTTLPDPEGVKHEVYLISASVNMRERKSLEPKKGGLAPDNL
jgi:hypothetical protein